MANRTHRAAVFAILSGVLLAALSCASGGKRVQLDPETRFRTDIQEIHLRRQDPWAAQQLVECARESAERRSWHFDDYVVDSMTESLFGTQSSCDQGLNAAPESKKPMDENKAIEKLIDKQLEDALTNRSR